MGRAIKWTATVLLVGALGVSWSAMTSDSRNATPAVVGDSVPADPSPPTVLDQPTAATSALPASNAEAVAELRFDQDEAGARTAAVAYLELTEDAVSLTPSAAAAIQRSIATAEFAAEFGADTEQKMIELTQTIPGGVVLRIAPIEVRSVANGDDWLVSVWYAQAITMVGEAVVDDWRTANYRMRWEDGTWRIAEFSSERGPTPGRGTQPASASAVQFEAILAGYSDDGLG